MWRKKLILIASIFFLTLLMFIISNIYVYFFQPNSQFMHVKTKDNGFHSVYYFDPNQGNYAGEGQIRLSLCSKQAQLVLLSVKLDKIHSCTSYPLTLSNGEKGFLILLSYGSGNDCPSGCFYDRFYSVVKGNTIYTVEDDNYFLDLNSDSKIYYDLNMHEFTITNRR